jgi:hypothetical protein
MPCPSGGCQLFKKIERFPATSPTISLKTTVVQPILGALADQAIAFTPALAAAERKLLSSVAKGSLSRRAKSK